MVSFFFLIPAVFFFLWLLIGFLGIVDQMAKAQVQAADVWGILFESLVASKVVVALPYTDFYFANQEIFEYLVARFLSTSFHLLHWPPTAWCCCQNTKHV
jgi:hypothetical protein